MGQVVVEDIPDHLVEHGEQGAQGSEPGEVHDVVEALCVLQGPDHQTVGREVLRKIVGTIHLHLAAEAHRVVLKRAGVQCIRSP